MSEHWHEVASVDDVESDYPHPVTVGDRKIALYNVDSKIYATDDICSHAYARLSDGFVEDCYVSCPLHNARFDVTTGAVVEGPATEPVDVIPVEIRDGQVFVLV